jgi:gliding motility-associated-like protein
MNNTVHTLRAHFIFYSFAASALLLISGYKVSAQNNEKNILNLSKQELIDNYTFYGGDSLALFDFEKAYDRALHVSHIVMPIELRNFFYIEETKFVKKKYNIPDAEERRIAEPHTLTAACNNLDFEYGDFTGWDGSWGWNSWSGPVPPAVYNLAGIGINTLGPDTPENICTFHTLITGAYGTDFYGGFPVPNPAIPNNNFCARLGGSSINLANSFACSNAPNSLYASAEVLSQTYVVTAANALIEYDYAIVLNNAPHEDGARPYFHVEIFDSLGNPVSPCLDYYVQATQGNLPPGFFCPGDTTDTICPIVYLPWTQNSINLTAYINQTITVKFTSAGCIYGGHWSYSYIDVYCGQVQIIIANNSCTSYTTLTAPPVANGSYLWTGPLIIGSDTSQTVQAGADGVYTVVVTYANGCSYTLVDTVDAIIPLICNTAGNNVSCYGGNNGSASVAISSGTAPYTYSWNTTPSQNLATATGLAAGIYSVSITDSTGCTVVLPVSITQPPAFVVNSATTNVSCYGGNNGSAAVNVTGATPGYIYTWTPAVGSGATASNLTAGNYTVTIRDNNGCTTSTTVAITQPPALAANSSTLSNVLCYGGSNGSIMVSASGGSPGYSYTWSPAGGNGVTANNLTAGNYTVTVRDFNGCIITSVATVTQPPVLAANSSTLANVLCYGGNNGSATVAASGGSPVYSYTWSPAGGNGATANNLTAGNYTVTIGDYNGCTITATAVVTQPPALAANASTLTNVLCNGGNNGSATVGANGGIPGYTYSWSPSGGNGVTANNLTAGNYSVTIRDNNGCTITSTTVVTQPPPLAANGSTLTNVLCFGGNNGSATVSANGGTPGYSYSWSPSGGNGITANNLTAGDYTVTILDNNNCAITATAVVTQPPALVVNASTLANIPCLTANIGIAAVQASGGTGGYSYTWMPSGGNGMTASNLGANTYSVTVQDANGCTQISTTVVTQSIPVTSSISGVINVSCFGNNNGQAIASGSGGTIPYSYSWSPSGGNNATAANLTAGNYTVSVTDLNGCTTVSTTVITQPALLIANGVNLVNVKCFGGNNGSVTSSANGGTAPYFYSWSPSGGNFATANNLTAGNYTVTVTDAHGCTTTSSAIVTQPPVLTAATDTLANVLCYGGNNGSAFVTAGGGTGTYSYLWNPAGGSTATASNLSAATYSVRVTDANGCTIIKTVVITQPPVLALSLNNPPTICINQSAIISASSVGGTSPYTYLWSNGATTSSQSVNPTVTSNYSITVTDAHGCTITKNITVAVHPPLNVLATSTPEICLGSTANISALGGGGNGGPYFYLWNTGQTSASFTVLPSINTIYNVTLNDGCSPAVQAATPVVVNPLPTVGFTPINAEDCVPVSVSFTDTANTISGCTYLWSFGDGTTSTDSTPSHNYTVAGLYGVTLTITTPKGCSRTLTRVDVVRANPLPVADFIIPNEVTLNEAVLINFNNLSWGSNAWLWHFGDNSDSSTVFNPSHSYIDTGVYVIQLISYSPALCPDTTYRSIKINGEFAIFIPNAFTPNGDGINDGFIAKGIYIKDYDMWILDRWGGKIYHSLSLSHPWNGTYFDDGTMCQNGVYVYKIKAHDVWGKLHEFIGHVTLVR